MSVGLEEKKSYILNFISTGIDVFSAYIEARLTDEEISLLEEDKEFQTEIEYITNQEKIRLIREYKRVAEAAAQVKLDPNALRNLIKDLHPDALAPEQSKRTLDFEKMPTIVLQGEAPK